MTYRFKTPHLLVILGFSTILPGCASIKPTLGSDYQVSSTSSEKLITQSEVNQYEKFQLEENKAIEEREIRKEKEREEKKEELGRFELKMATPGEMSDAYKPTIQDVENFSLRFGKKVESKDIFDNIRDRYEGAESSLEKFRRYLPEDYITINDADFQLGLNPIKRIEFGLLQRYFPDSEEIRAEVRPGEKEAMVYWESKEGLPKAVRGPAQAVAEAADESVGFFGRMINKIFSEYRPVIATSVK